MTQWSSEVVEDNEHPRRAVPVNADTVPRRGRVVISLSRWLGSEWPFVAALLLGATVRLITMLGFPPIMWYNDGFEYLGVALRFHAYRIRPDGYAALLRLLLPFHSFTLVAALQHLMGLAIATMLYLVLRHWRVNRWLATAAVLVPLLDVHEIELEHLLLSDTLFSFLVVLAVTLLCWHRRMPTHLAALTGAALALASLTRTVGVPLVVIGAIFVLIRSAGWRPVVAYLALAVTPLVAYAGWFNSEQGQFNLTNADGVFLYARVMAFADCNIIKPPASLASLCDPRPPSQRPPGEAYIWHASLLEGFGPVAERALPEQRFTTARNEAALKFATRAIEAQPLSYLSVSLRDFGRTFGWSWEPYPNGAEVATYKFSDHPYGILDRVVVAGGTALGDAHRYDPSPSTRVVEPFADLMIGYQRILAARGPFIGVFLLVGLMGLLLPRRRIERRRELLIMLTFATVLLLVPPFTVEFDYRYVVPAIPLAAASCAMALAAMFPRCSDPGFTAEKPIRPRRRKAANFADAGGADSNGQLSGSPLC